MKFLHNNAAARFSTLIVFLLTGVIRGPQGVASIAIFVSILFAQSILPKLWSKYWKKAVATTNRRLSLAFIRKWRFTPWVLVLAPYLAADNPFAAAMVLGGTCLAFAGLILIIIAESRRDRSAVKVTDKDQALATEPSIVHDIANQRKNARFLLHIGDGVEAMFQVDLWYSYCKSVDPSVILVNRSDALFRRMRSTRPEIYVEYVKAGLEAEKLVSACPNLLGVLYVSNTGNTVHFLRLNHLRHVFVGHGDSEKAASCHKFFRAYDEVWTAGLAHIDRFRNSGQNFSSIRFRIVGRPTLRPLLELETTSSCGRFLYLPTWEGFQADQEYTSLPEAEDFIPALVALTGRQAVVKLHPLTGKRNTQLLKVEEALSNASTNSGAEILVVERNKPVTETMAKSDFLVADVSSVVSDYLTLGRPIFLYVLGNQNLRMSASSIPPDAYCYTFNTPEQLLALVERVINQGDDYLYQARQEARQYFVDVNRSLGRQFEKELETLIVEMGKPVRSRLPRAAIPVGGERQEGRPWIVGHRGAKGLFIENSLSGFSAAAAMEDLDAIEFDLHLTADRKLVVIHDPSLNRTTTGKGPVSRYTLDELSTLRLKPRQRGDDAMPSEGIPTLDEVLDILVPSGKELHIEIKNDALGEVYQGLVPSLIETARRRGIMERCVFTSFSPDVLEEVRRLDGNARLLASLSLRSVELLGGLESALTRFERCGGCSMAVEYVLFKTIQAQWPTRFDYRQFGVWVINDESDLRRCKDLGVRQITTDRPDLAISILKKDFQHEYRS